MRILYDEPKRLKILQERGVDVAALAEEFFEVATIADAKNGRLRAIGPFDGKLVTVIFRPMGKEAVAVVTMRPASRNERKLV